MSVDIREVVATIVDRLFEAGVDLEKLDVTNNRVNVVSMKRGSFGIRVRIARSLLGLGSQIIEPVVGFVARRPLADEQLRQLIRQIPVASKPVSKRRIMIRSQGYFHDLRTIAGKELAHLEGLSDIHITWGQRRGIKKGQRHIRFGSYDCERRVVRVHPLLDNPKVPSWFIGFVIYHECLHEVLGFDVVNGRRRPHSKEFRKREAEHPRYDEAQAWEKANINRLLAGKL